MDISHFVDNYTNSLDILNEKNIEKYNYKLKDEIEKKETKEIKSYKEMKKFTDSRKKYYEKQTNIDNEDNLDIFENSIIKTDEVQKNFFDLDYDNKLSHILDYIKRKKIKLTCDLEVISEILNDNDKLKKYITIDKTYNMINKISFFKKKESGDYDIVFNNSTKKITKKNFFIKK